MGNSLRKNIELAVLDLQNINIKIKEKYDINLTNENVINSLQYFDAIPENEIKTIENESKLTKLIDDAYEIVALKQSIHKYLKSNNINIKDISFEKINNELNSDKNKNKEYQLYRAFLYKKHIPVLKTFTCDDDKINFENILKNKLFILEKNQNKYNNKQLCQLMGKTTEDEVVDILKLNESKTDEPILEEDEDDIKINKKNKKKKVIIEEPEPEPEPKKKKKSKKEEDINEKEIKKCGPKNSKKNPAYTRTELIKLLKDNSDKLKLNKNLISKMTKNQMCKFLPKLGIDTDLDESSEKDFQNVELDDILKNLLEEVEKAKLKRKKEYSESELESLIGSEKKCGPMNTKKNPAYTRDEIVNIIIPHMDKYNLSKNKINKMSKTELCEYVEKIKGIKIDKSEIVDLKDAEKEIERIESEPIITKKDKNKLKEPEDEEEPEEPEEEEEEDDDILISDIAKKIKERVKEKEREKEKKKKELIPSKKDDENESKENEEDIFKTDKKGIQCYTPYNKDVELKEHQIRVAKHMLKHRGLLAIHGTGTGKTLTAVASMNCILQNFPNMNIIIITPTSLISNFKKELKKFGLDIEKPQLKKRITFYSFKEFVINIHKNTKNFQMCKESFIIIDEAHNLRNLEKVKERKKQITETPKGINAATILQCVKSASKILLLTATPMQNRISDIDSLIAMIDGTDVKPLPKGYSLSDIEKKFKCKISINPGNKSSDDFPLRIDVPHSETTFTMDQDYYEKYLDIQEELGEAYAHHGYKSNMFYNAVRRAALSLDKEESPKVEWTFNKIKEEFQKGRKTVVYTAWRESGVKYVRILLDRNKIPYGVYTGDMTKNQRDVVRDAYNNGKIKVLIITRAGGEGLDLKNTNNVILMEPNWNKEMDEQIIGRAIRYKSHAELPKELRYVNVYKLYMYKPDNLFDDDQLPSADEILYKMSYEEKDPLIKDFMKILETFSIENVKNCDECCIVKKSNEKSLNDSEFFDYYTYIKPPKDDEDDEEKKETKKTKKKKNYEVPEGADKTYMYNYKKKKSKSSSKSKSKTNVKNKLKSK
jgi:SNF2 family DNA or RNA helicase